VPRESFDAPENLSKEALRQVAFGQLQDEVPRMSDETPAGLEEPLLEARQRPTLNRQGESDPTQEVAEVVGDDPSNNRTSVARNRWQESRVQWVAALPSLIHCSTVPRWL